jgi:hypothetical protein
MKMVIAIATTLLAMTASASEVITYTKGDVTAYVHTSTGFVCDQQDPTFCYNEGGSVPGWMKKLNDWAAANGLEVVETCGEHNACPNEGGKVPAWLEKLNQWFLDHGFQAPAQDSPYIGG